MTVADLRKLLEDAPDEMLIGAKDPDGVTCEIQSACILSDHATGAQFFFIHANGGYPLFGD